MKRNTAIFTVDHAKRIFSVLALSSGVAVVACGQAASEDDHACPCSAGFVCCQDQNVCVAEGAVCPLSVQCPAGMMLSSSSQTDAGTSPTIMSGDPLGSLADGAKIAFDYASSASAQNGEVTLQGWMVNAGHGLTLTFQTFASDGTSSAPMQLVAYGPTELGPNPGTCLAPLSGSAPITTGPGTFDPPEWGQYFIAPYHPLDVSKDGTTSLAATNNQNSSAAFFQMNIVAK